MRNMNYTAYRLIDHNFEIIKEALMMNDDEGDDEYNNRFNQNQIVRY